MEHYSVEGARHRPSQTTGGVHHADTQGMESSDAGAAAAADVPDASRLQELLLGQHTLEPHEQQQQQRQQQQSFFDATPQAHQSSYSSGSSVASVSPHELQLGASPSELQLGGGGRDVLESAATDLVAAFSGLSTIRPPPLSEYADALFGTSDPASQLQHENGDRQPQLDSGGVVGRLEAVRSSVMSLVVGRDVHTHSQQLQTSPLVPQPPKLLDAPELAAYQPAQGLHLLFDFVTGLPLRATKVQVRAVCRRRVLREEGVRVWRAPPAAADAPRAFCLFRVSSTSA